MTVLLLSGTTEGRELAHRVPVISSLAGRTRSPLLPPGEVRIGGFGGVPGLVDFLRTREVDAVVDATHPFAATMTAHAAEACTSLGLPLLILRRPGFASPPSPALSPSPSPSSSPVPSSASASSPASFPASFRGDRWHRVPSLSAAAALLPGMGARVFLTTGRQSIAAFAPVRDCWFLSRSVEPPTPPMPARLSVLLDRGPFTLASELDLLTTHAIDVIVTKDSGGATAKLDAARSLCLPVIMVDRPPLPPGIPTVATVDAAVEWLSQLG